MSMSEARKVKYMKNPMICPYCESNDLEITSKDNGEKQYTERVYCNHCEKEWEDVYKLVDVR